MVKLDRLLLKENIPNFKQYCRLKSMIYVEKNTYEFYGDQWPNPKVIMVVAANPTKHEIAFYASDAQDLQLMFSNLDIKLHLGVKISSLDKSFLEPVTQWITSLGYTNEYTGYYNTWQADLDTINWPEIEKIASSVDALTIEDADTIDENWNLRHVGSLDYIKFNIANRGGGCIRGSDGKPIAWCGIHRDGSLGMAFTFPESRGKGYLKRTEAFCMLQLKEKRLTPFLHINDQNEASMRSAKSLGFRSHDLVVFLAYDKVYKDN